MLKFLFWKACDVGKLEREGLGCKIEGFCHALFAPSLDFTSASYIVFKNCSLGLYLDLQFFDLICSWSTCPNTVGILRVGYRNFWFSSHFPLRASRWPKHLCSQPQHQKNISHLHCSLCWRKPWLMQACHALAESCEVSRMQPKLIQEIADTWRGKR